MSSNTQPQFPNISAPMVDSKGYITPAWQQLLTVFWQRLNAIQTSQGEVGSQLQQATQDAVLLAKPDVGP